MKREDPKAVADLAAARAARRNRPKVHPRVEYDLRIRENPDYYTAVRFHPSRGFQRLEAPDLKSATELAKGLISLWQDTRPVMVYAVRGDQQALVGTLSASGAWKDSVLK